MSVHPPLKLNEPFLPHPEEEEQRRAKDEPECAGISWGMTDDDGEVSGRHTQE
jgi:hypothetical protein